MPGQQAQRFDVFMCHNSEDKPAVIEIAEQLRHREIEPLLDMWEFQPGTVWQFALEQQIERIGAVAVFVGQNGMGLWQRGEIYALLHEFARRKCPVVPVMLPSTKTRPQLPIFLRNRYWVDFRLQKPDPLLQLQLGIMGKGPSGSVEVLEWMFNQNIEQITADINVPVVDVQYAKLERYLQNGQWKEADEETYQLMLTEVGKDAGQRLDWEDLLHFPHEPLRAIDSLWVRHSVGQFGFSVQNELYLSCVGAMPDGKFDVEVLNKLCEWNGWDSIIKYDLTAPSGHLPTTYLRGGISLLSRLDFSNL